MRVPGLHKVVSWRLGQLRRRGASLERRIDVAERYARLQPRDPYAWAIWGNLLARNGRYEEAERVLRRGLELHPHAFPAIGWLLAKSLTNQSRFPEARAVLDEQVRAFPDLPLPRLGLAEIELVEHRWDIAKTLIDEALERTSSGDAVAWYEAARLLALVPGERTRAIGLIEDAMQAGLPSWSDPHLVLGVLLELEGNQGADEHLEQAEALWEGPKDFAAALRNAREALGSIG